MLRKHNPSQTHPNYETRIPHDQHHPILLRLRRRSRNLSLPTLLRAIRAIPHLFLRIQLPPRKHLLTRILNCLQLCHARALRPLSHIHLPHNLAASCMPTPITHKSRVTTLFPAYSQHYESLERAKRAFLSGQVFKTRSGTHTSLHDFIRNQIVRISLPHSSILLELKNYLP